MPRFRRDGIVTPRGPTQTLLDQLEAYMNEALPNPGDSSPLPTAAWSVKGVDYPPEFTLPPSSGSDTDETLALLLPLLILLSTLLFLLLLFLLFLILVRRQRGISLSDDDGPLDLSREEDREGEGGIVGVENRWLDTVDEGIKTGYIRAKAWQAQYQPNSQPTDITLSQYLSIQEKGVSAWSFDPDYESNPPVMVQSRTEIMFLADGVGMAAEEGGGACVQSNLPLPRLNEVYYWECKLFEKPETTTVAVGLATKPYPSFRLPGWNRYSVGYFSADGFKAHNYPFNAQSYGPPLSEGDVIGVGYRPRTGAVFFTRNGKKLEDAYVGLNRHNVFPTVGANGAATIHVNLGQAGFVFIEANVKKWGLAPTIGTLAPPPAYGSERGSILLATANMTGSSRTPRRHRQRRPRSTPTGDVASPSPLRVVSPDRIPWATNEDDRSGSGSSSPVGSPRSDHSDDLPHNPPTPHQLDISLQSLSPFSLRQMADDAAEEVAAASTSLRPPRLSSRPSYDVPPDGPGPMPTVPDRSPPAYNPIDQNTYAPGVAEAMLADHFANSGHIPPGLLTIPAPVAYEARQTPSPTLASPSPSEPSPNITNDGRWFGLFGRLRSTSRSPDPNRSGA